ncbi:thioredoxin family protein [Paenibacillus campi]|uniref:thioredoxin family protein n=1 Tax=Paenibacillus campi TaxID=3106031 RepID=UPI002AFEA941|nr:thioredoxin family protein [Paenibacillus sp. SGZ-1014]
MIQELNEAQALQLAEQSGEPAVLYAYTPLCGTCKMGRRMLEAALPLLPEHNVYALNINFAPRFVQQLQLTSVPCLIVFEAWRERKPRLLYRLESVQRMIGHIRDTAV